MKGVTGYFQAVLGGVTGEQLHRHGGRRTRGAVRLGQGDFQHDRRRQVDAEDSRQCGAAHPGRDVPRHQRRAGLGAQSAVPADDEHAGVDSRLPVLSPRWPGADRRALRHRRRAATPPRAAPILELPAEDRARGAGVRAQHRVDTGAPRVPPPDCGRRPPHPDARSATPGVARTARSKRHRGRAPALLADPEFVYRGELEPPTVRPARRYADQRPRARVAPVRSSSGAAFPTIN